MHKPMGEGNRISEPPPVFRDLFSSLYICKLERFVSYLHTHTHTKKEDIKIIWDLGNKTVFTKTLVLVRVMVVVRPPVKPQAEGGSTGSRPQVLHCPLHPSKPRWAHLRVICDAVSLQGNLGKPPSKERGLAEEDQGAAGFGTLHP